MSFPDTGSKLMERGIAMCEMPFALLVDDGSPWSAGLKDLLVSRGFAVYSAGSCGEAALLLHSYTPPHLVFTDLHLPDGSWSGIISLAESAPVPTSVIVVSRQVEIDSYVQVLERGAFDYIVPPFEASEIDHIIRCALGNVQLRRQLHRTMATEESQMADDACGPEDDLLVAFNL